MKSDVFFSVVIPTYNRELLLMRALDSVLNQTFHDFEVWIVDDGSTDDTEKTVRSMRDKRVNYIKITNSERGAARNTGIRSSSGQYVTFLDSDDVLYPNHLSFVSEKLKSLGSPEFYHQGYVIVSDRGKIMQKPYRGRHLEKALFTRGNVMSCMGVFVRRDVLADNLFKESRILAGLEDWELWIRLASQFRLHYDPTVTAALMHHGQRGSAKVDRSKLVKQALFFTESILANSLAVTKYSRYMNHLLSNVSSFVSLQLSGQKQDKNTAWKYFFQSVKRDKAQLVRKRTLAILRNLIFR